MSLKELIQSEDNYYEATITSVRQRVDHVKVINCN